MKTVLLAFGLTVAAAGAAQAQRYAPPPIPIPYGLTPEEARDYRQDQLERRQEMERDALEARQKAQRRLTGVDDED